MNDTVIQVANLSKRYRLGVVGTGTLSHDLNRWWAKVRGRPDPTLKVGPAAAGGRQLPEGGDRLPSSDYMWALNDISFEVRRGEILGIIGGNGAGKSTVLKILSRVTAPTSGEVRVKGRIASLLEVGTGFHPELTGRENILLNGAILGMRKAETARKFDEIVAFSGVEQYIDTPVKRYSSGMYVRLAFAVAAHLDPEILIVDEVLAVGDAEFQKKCLGKMGDIARGGRTVVFVSHNMDAVRRLCSRALWLDAGRVQLDGATAECVVAYLQRGGMAVTGQRVFSPPLAFGNGMPALLRTVRVSDAKGRTAKRFSCASALKIDIEWEATEPLHKPRIGFILRTGDGSEVLTALDATAWESAWRQPGLWTSSCSIPSGLLNEGEYTLDFGCDSPNRHDFRQGLTGGVLRFQLDDDMTISSKYYGEEGFRDSRWPGVLLLDLPWECVVTREPSSQENSLDANETDVESGEHE